MLTLPECFGAESFSWQAKQVLDEALTKLEWETPQVTSEQLESVAKKLRFSISEIADGVIISNDDGYYVTCSDPPKLKRTLSIDGEFVRVELTLLYMSSMSLYPRLKNALIEECGLSVEPVALPEKLLRLPTPPWQTVSDGSFGPNRWLVKSEAQELWQEYKKRGQETLKEEFSVQLPLSTWAGAPFDATVYQQSQIIPKAEAEQKWAQFCAKAEAILN